MTKLAKTDFAVIISRFLAGETSGDLAKDFPVSRARILQVLKERGVDISKGGRAIKPRKAVVAKEERRAARVLKDYGVSTAVFDEFTKEVKKAYTAHRLNHKRRGLGWNFTLETWAAVWEASGEWDNRGRGKNNGKPKAIMAQPDKTKPIGPDNCRITTLSEALTGRPRKRTVSTSEQQVGADESF